MRWKGREMSIIEQVESLIRRSNNANIHEHDRIASARAACRLIAEHNLRVDLPKQKNLYE